MSVHPDSLWGRLERAAMAAGALLLLAIVVVSMWSALRTGADVAKATNSFMVRSLSRDVLDAVTAAESSQRGYLLTGKLFYLQPYKDNIALLPDKIRRLSEATPDDPDFASWRAAIQEKLDELALTVTLATQGKRDQAIALVQSDRGQHTMDRVRTLALRMTQRQRERLMTDLNRSNAGVRLVIAVDIAAFLVLVLLVAVIVIGIQRYATRMRTTQAALKSAHDELAARRPILEAAVAERTAELSRANDELQRFAYIVSHDLRAPLLNIIGFTSELDGATRRLNDYVVKTMAEGGGTVPEDVRLASEEDLPEAIRFIRTSTTKMDRLINAILRLSREGRRLLSPEKLDMNVVVADLLGSLKHQIEEAGADVKVASLPPLVCDRTAIDQIFSNLLENALKYTAPGRLPVIEVAGRTHVDRDARRLVSYTVADNGRGIAERDMERIFELFRRSGVQDRPGEGIGLAHVRALVRRLGGDISCSSTPDVGTIFTLTLPAVFSAAGGFEG
jgi:signal transduction histidine kinase